MQKFENGESVEVRESLTSEWYSVEYLSFHPFFNHHVVDKGECYYGFIDSNIRPIQQEEEPANVDDQNRISDLLEQIKVKDAEIEKLHAVKCYLDIRIDKLIKQNENLHTIRNVVYEIVNAPIGNKFELIQKDSHNFDVKVRQPVY